MLGVIIVSIIIDLIISSLIGYKVYIENKKSLTVNTELKLLTAGSLATKAIAIILAIFT